MSPALFSLSSAAFLNSVLNAVFHSRLRTPTSSVVLRSSATPPPPSDSTTGISLGASPPPSSSPIQSASISPPDAFPSSIRAVTLPFSNPASELHTRNSPPARASRPVAAPFSSSTQLLFQFGPNPPASASPLP